jgi:hypothetical protein
LQAHPEASPRSIHELHGNHFTLFASGHPAEKATTHLSAITYSTKLAQELPGVLFASETKAVPNNRL